jgi:hypothetical protein
MKCSYCNYIYQARPKYCPNCGRINIDDIQWNVLRINERKKTEQLTQEDLRYIADVNNLFADANRQFAKIDMRTPFERWTRRIGWILGAIGVVILGVSFYNTGQPNTFGIALLMFAGGLLGLITMINGQIRYGPRAACMIPVLLIVGFALILSLMWDTMFPYNGPVRDQKSILYNCYSWKNIRPDMAGSDVCVYGKILKYSADSTSTTIYFGENISDFYLTSTEYEFPGVKQGQCVTASGRVFSRQGVLVIDISDLTEVIPSSTCDKYP